MALYTERPCWLVADTAVVAVVSLLVCEAPIPTILGNTTFYLYKKRQYTDIQRSCVKIQHLKMQRCTEAAQNTREVKKTKYNMSAENAFAYEASRQHEGNNTHACLQISKNTLLLLTLAPPPTALAPASRSLRSQRKLHAEVPYGRAFRREGVGNLARVVGYRARGGAWLPQTR